MVALVSGIIKRVVFADWTVSSLLGTREAVRSGWKLGGPVSYPTHSGRESHHFGSHDLGKWLHLSASTFSSVGKGEWSASAPALSPRDPRMNAILAVLSSPGLIFLSDHFPASPSVGRQKPPVSSFLPPPPPGTSVRMLPSDSALPTPSLPWCSLSPQFLLMHPLSLTVIYFSSHCLFPPTTPSPKTAVGIQMRLDFLQRTFWAATQQVGVMEVNSRSEGSPTFPR